ncbi:MAG TPA: NHLP-related RiPP peptide [Rhodanobacteraceae bacterium]|nr:NHLP-related RiPP peptide [Rhodanobacteraceae bacterium]
MADSKLSREHSLALLHKLANDDGFRSRYEQKPAAALAELGVPHETIVNLKGSCLAPTNLADKAHFSDAHSELTDAAADCCMAMIVPSVKMNFGPSD